MLITVVLMPASCDQLDHMSHVYALAINEIDRDTVKETKRNHLFSFMCVHVSGEPGPGFYF